MIILGALISHFRLFFQIKQWFLSKFRDPGTKTLSKSTFFYSSRPDIQGTIAKKNPKNYSDRQSPFIFKFGPFFTYFNCIAFYFY